MSELEYDSPLLLPGFLSFSAAKWGLQPQVVTLGNKGAGGIATVLYTNRRGKVLRPKLVAYTPVEFSVPAGTSLRKRQSLWLELAGILAEKMRVLGVSGFLPLCPEVTDVRPWQWRGFDAQLRYTFVLLFPDREELRYPAVRKQLRKAMRLGMKCTRQTDSSLVVACLEGSENRQGFSYGLTRVDLENARLLIGDEHLRMYTCHSPTGEVVGARAALFKEGSRAIDWLAGTTQSGLSVGATQLLLDYMLSDLEASGATGLDFAGANLESVAYAKMSWGAELVSYPVVGTFGVKQTARSLRNWLRVRYAARRTA